MEQRCSKNEKKNIEFEGDNASKMRDYVEGRKEGGKNMNSGSKG